MMKKMFLGMAAAAAVLGAAEPKVIAQMTNQADWEALPKVVTVKEGTITVNAVKPTYLWHLSKKSYPVKADKTYVLSWEYRRLPGAPAGVSPIYFGLAPVDAENKIIPAVAVNPTNNSETELAAAVKKGDKQVFLKDCSKWPKNMQWQSVVFNAKKDLSDLPNNSWCTVVSMAKKDANWVVSLREAAKADYPAGTAIRLQRHGAQYLYALYNVNPPQEWTKGSYTYKGVGKKEGYGFRPGTKSVRLFIGGVGSKPCTVEIRNYKLVEL